VFNLYVEGRISVEQALANADSANNLRLRIKNYDLSRPSLKKSPAGGQASDDIRMEGGTPPNLRRV
jgi:twitching motility protein PilU